MRDYWKAKNSTEDVLIARIDRKNKRIKKLANQTTTVSTIVEEYEDYENAVKQLEEEK
jgi:hypothetical protein